MTVGAAAIDVTGELSDTERAVLGTASLADVVSLFDGYARARLGSPMAKVLFRAGRIDAVWGVELGDGREVVIKSPPAPGGPRRPRGRERCQGGAAGRRFPLSGTVVGS